MIIYVQRFLHWLTFSYRAKPSRTVRFAFPLVFSTIALIGAALILPTDASYIRIESNSTAVTKGEQITVRVYAGAHVPVNAVNIELSYPENQMRVASIETGQSVITLWTEEPYAEAGVVYLTGGTYRKGFLGEHLIATVDFISLVDGQAQFSADGVEFYAGDGSGSKVSVADSGTESLVVRVGDVTASGVITGSAEIIVVTDIDGDGEVTMSDIISFMSAWQNKNIVYDFNNDRRMNFVDFAIILADSFYK